MSLLDNFKTPLDIQLEIAKSEKDLRLSRNISQKKLSEFSGVPLGTIRRFEQTGEISLQSLVLLAIALNRAQDLTALFHEDAPVNLFAPSPKIRFRASSL